MNKKVFISYSWGNSEHQEWIVNLATRLMNDTVDVILDRWSLKDGHDIHSFMEEMVKAEDVFRVLIISDKKYSEKADGREGGVGTETQIITPNIYSKEKQEKFIPIVLARDENNNPYLPIYLKSRKYIDFSRVEVFEDAYEELLRNILEAPSLPKPKLGTKPPAYITDSVVNLSETNNKLRTIQNQLLKNGKVSSKELDDFLDLFSERLWDFQIKEPSGDLLLYGDQLINTLKSYKSLREDFIKFIDLTSSNVIDNIDEPLIIFFENARRYDRPKEDVGSWKRLSFEIFEIIFHELFIYTIAVVLKNKNYDLVADLLNSKYYISDTHRSKKEPDSFTFLYDYHQNLEEYASKKFKKITGFGDYIITNLSEALAKEDIISADTLCYFISHLEGNSIYHRWFPKTYLYGERGGTTFFDKIASKKHFERVKGIFNVDSKEQFIKKLDSYKATNPDKIMYGRGRFECIPFIYELVEPEKIGIYR